jgi:hypothetical protein
MTLTLKVKLLNFQDRPERAIYDPRKAAERRQGAKKDGKDDTSPRDSPRELSRESPQEESQPKEKDEGTPV